MLKEPISQLWLSVLLYNCAKALRFQPAQAVFELSPSLNTALSDSSNRQNLTLTKSTSSHSCLPNCDKAPQIYAWKLRKAMCLTATYQIVI